VLVVMDRYLVELDTAGLWLGHTMNMDERLKCNLELCMPQMDRLAEGTLQNLRPSRSNRV